MERPAHYRRDIDGLRALAIIPVLLYHFDIRGFSGGFVGVDIFFVISGYLITTIILRELRTGHFSLVKFWERRFRRITPALFVVLVATTVAGYFIILFPPDYKDFGASLSAQSVFLANLWFMRTDDYFAAPSETVPLLHTWSLAVEEQFYIFFPIILWFLYLHVRRYINHVLLLGFGASLLYCVYLVNIDPTTRFTIPFLPHLWGGATNLAAGFYFTLPRAFELLLGAMVATTGFVFHSKQHAQPAAWLGLGLIIWSITQFTHSTDFPGASVLIPTIGTALLIISHTNHHTFISRLLSFPLFVGVGLISYSLYLWHWPILVLGKYWFQSELTALVTSALLTLSLLCAVGSYYLVETPFRTKKIFPNTTRMLLGGVAMLAVLFSLGFFIVTQQGLPGRAPSAAQAIAEAAVDFNLRRDECFKKSIADIVSKKDPCLLGEQNPDQIDFVLWGDSHADAVMPAFDQFGINNKQTGIFFGVGGCAPLTPSIAITIDQNCELEKSRAIEFINSQQPQTVYLVSEWKEGYVLPDKTVGIPIGRALMETINAFPPETQVVIMKRIPTYPETDFRTLFKTTVQVGEIPHLVSSRQTYEKSTEQINNQIVRVTELLPQSRSLDPTKTLCDDTQCYFSTDETVLYRDGSHLTRTAALEFILPILIEDYIVKSNNL